MRQAAGADLKLSKATAWEMRERVRNTESHSMVHAHEFIDSFAGLQPNWDSYGADSISPQAITVAHHLLAAVAQWCVALPDKLIAPYFVTPLASGGVQIEWRGISKSIEVVVRSDDKMDYLVENLESGATDEATSEDFCATVAAITAVLRSG